LLAAIFIRQLHVHVVAGIVAVQAGHASAVVGGAERIEEALGGGRGKNLADGHGVDQAGADVAEESRLMARAAGR